MHEVQDQEMRTQFFAARIGHDLINRRVDMVEWSWNVVDAWKQIYQWAECVHALPPLVQEMAMMAKGVVGIISKFR